MNSALGDHLNRNTLELLWCKSANRLSKEELESLANFNEFAAIEVGSIAEVLRNIGTLVVEDKISGAFQDKESVSVLCWNISYQLSQLQSLIMISDEARDLLNNMIVTHKVGNDAQQPS